MPKFVAHKSFGRQVLAVFLKDWTYQFKQSLATFAVYFVGMMVIILMKGQVGLSKETMCPDGTTGALLENSGSYRSYDPSGALYGHQGFPNCRPEVTTSRIGSSMGLCSPGSVRGCLPGDFYLSTLLYSSSRSQGILPYLCDVRCSERHCDLGRWERLGDFWFNTTCILVNFY
ncbi:hypothetical protein BC828DRAFT_231115 [Blastocladiella britannica]|nr:hypothetical protein BC828DRAFT_231115 [Blastocladiella britannica]